jgi:hypothetical protein
MDMGFLLRAERMLASPRRAEIDHGVLVALIAAQQAASPTARAAAKPKSDAPGTPIVELLLAGPAWQEAARAQQGRFHRSAAREQGADRQPRSPENLPSHFSVPSTLRG